MMIESRLAIRGSRFDAPQLGMGEWETGLASLTLLLSRAMPGRRKALSSVAVLLLLAAGAIAANGHLRAAAFVAQAAGMQGFARTAASLETGEFDERALTVPWRGGQLRARMYVPRGASDRAMLLVPGVHAAGVDEPRLMQFARDLASVRHTMLTVELTDLTQYRITARTTDMIEDAALWLSEQHAVAPDGRVGMMGISFAGGLSIVAASRPALRDHVAFVMSFGGHGDLPRTLRYLCTGIRPDGSQRPPHDYGVVIILLSVADQVVPPDQVEPLRKVILTYLEASRLDLVDKNESWNTFQRARAMTASLPDPSKTLMDYVNDRDVTHLGPILLPHVSELGDDRMLSPAREAAPPAPVYLLHGTDDNVIPAIESSLLAETLRARGVTVHHLATPLITHAEVDRSATASAMWRLVRFWADLLGE
jgi:dienelactone hydrolase